MFLVAGNQLSNFQVLLNRFTDINPVQTYAGAEVEFLNLFSLMQFIG